MKQWSMILMIAGLICVAEGAFRLRKPDLRFFQLRQAEKLDSEQRREYMKRVALSTIFLGAVCLLGASLMERLGGMKTFLLLFGGLIPFYIYTLWINKRYLGSYTLVSGEEGKARRVYTAVVLILYLAVFLGFSWYADLRNYSLAMFLILAGILLAAQMILFRKKK